MFKRCIWNQEECDPAYIKKEYTNMGLCYTVNWNPSDLLYSKDTGKQRNRQFASLYTALCNVVYAVVQKLTFLLLL